MALSHDILKDLVQEYQISKSPAIFARILKRCDGVLLSTIHKYSWRKGIAKQDMRDLYHTAIVGLGRAALTSPVNEDSEKVLARIIAYVRLELDNDYYEKHKPNDEKFVPYEHIEGQVAHYDDYSLIEYGLLRELLEKAVLSGVLTKAELLWFIKRHEEEAGFLELGQEIGLKRDGARKKYLQIEKKLKKWMNEKRSVFDDNI